MTSPRNDDGAFLIKERFIRHKYTVIPSDQQELLSRSDAWNTKGIPNIPPKVLQDVKKAYARRLRSATASERATPKRIGSGRVNGPSHQKNRHAAHATEEVSTDGQETVLSGDDDDDGEPIDWTPSPSHHRQAPARREELSTPGPSRPHAPSSSPVRPPKRPLPASSAAQPHSIAVPSSPPLPARQVSPVTVSQTPVKNAGRPKTSRPAPVVSAKARVAQQAPPSSLASEPDLEYQAPRAITDAVDPVDRALRPAQSLAPAHRVLRSTQQPAPTPPSAQEPATVLCTWKEPSSSETRQQTVEEPAQKRRRLKESPPSESSKAPGPDGAASLSGGRQAHISLNDSQTSTFSSAPSVIASTPAKRHSDHRLGRGPGQPLPAGFTGLEHLPTVFETDEEGYGSSRPVQLAQAGSFDSSGRLPPNGSASQAPFVAFKVAYPTYKGTVRDFVCAAISIIQLQESRSLAEFLYDDYIRVWAHHYMNYVEDCVQAGRNPLRAIQWYNEYVLRPVFTKRIFTKGNITDITGRHRAEAESYRRDIGHLHSSPLSVRAAPSPATRVTSHSARESVRLDGSAAGHDVLSPPRDASPPATTSNGALPDPEPPRNDRAPAKAALGTPTGALDMHGALRAAQIERIEPLRSVPGYVVTVSQSGSSTSEMINAPQDSPPAALPEVKEEEDRRPLAHIPAINADTDRKGALATTPASRSTNLGRARTPSGRNKSSANTDHISTPNALARPLEDSSHGVSDLTSGSKPPPASATEPSPARPKSPPSSFGDVLTQPPATAASLVPDFAASIIPETAVKVKDVPRLIQQSAKRRVSLAVNSVNIMPPPSSTAPTSSTVQRKKLTRADRFRLFVQRRQAQSSAPSSSVQG